MNKEQPKTWDETFKEFFNTLGDKYKSFRNQIYNYLEDINQNPKNFKVRCVSDPFEARVVGEGADTDKAISKLQEIVDKVVSQPTFDQDYFGMVEVTDSYRLGDTSIEDKSKGKKYEGLKKEDEYEIFLGTFNDNKFTWYSVGKYTEINKAYKAFKSYVNTQLKYTDEELKKVWETGRLDVELRQGNRLLNWVGIYSREVTKLTRAEEHAVQGGKKKRGKPLGAKKFQIAKVHGIAKDSRRYTVELSDADQPVMSVDFFSKLAAQQFIDSLDTDLKSEIVDSCPECGPEVFEEKPCTVICITTNKPKEFMSVEEAVDFVNAQNAVREFNEEPLDEWDIKARDVDTETPDTNFEMDKDGVIWIESNPDVERLIKELEEESEHPMEEEFAEINETIPDFVLAGKDYVTVKPDDPYYDKLKRILGID